jgi:DNA-directed RNA polymerase specialized sigma24 family protein
MAGVPLRAIDEEDIAQEAFWGFVKSVRDGRVPQLASRNELFALLTHIVACKAATQVERALTAKRGAGRVRGESALDARCDGGAMGINNISANDSTPAEEAALADCYQFYIASLPEALRPVAELHVAGTANREIAAQLGCVDRTVERKLALIRVRWQEMAEEELKS